MLRFAVVLMAGVRRTDVEALTQHHGHYRAPDIQAGFTGRGVEGDFARAPDGRDAAVNLRREPGQPAVAAQAGVTEQR